MKTTNTYNIHGQVTCYYDGSLYTHEIDDYAEGETAQSALANFLDENDELQFFGTVASVDAETRGGEWVIYKDKNEGQTLYVEKV